MFVSVALQSLGGGARTVLSPHLLVSLSQAALAPSHSVALHGAGVASADSRENELKCIPCFQLYASPPDGSCSMLQPKPVFYLLFVFKKKTQHRGMVEKSGVKTIPGEPRVRTLL